jgi:hypothetical protein
LDIDDDVLSLARELASERRTSIGAELSALARRGSRPTTIAVIDDLPLIRAQPGDPIITSSMVRDALDDE